MLNDGLFGRVRLLKVEVLSSVRVFVGHLVFCFPEDKLRVSVVREGCHLGLVGSQVGPTKLLWIPVGPGRVSNFRDTILKPLASYWVPIKSDI